jgi:hypothetical protein
MAVLKTIDGRFLINESPLQFGLIRQARNLYHVDLQRARDKAAELRIAGLEIYAASDAGTFDDPAYVAPTKEVDLSVSWPAVDWRVEIEQLSENRFRHVFFVDGVQRSVLGSSAQDVVDRLYGTFDPAIRAYLQSITPEPVAEVVIPTAPVIDLPKKILRTGDRSLSSDDWAELEVSRAAKQAPKVPPVEIEFFHWYNTASSQATRDRMQKDPAFFEWLKREGILDPRSNAYADARV